MIRDYIIDICANYGGSPGAAEISGILKRDYGIDVSIGRVCRLLDKIYASIGIEETEWGGKQIDKIMSLDHLQARLNPDAPNQIWSSDFISVRIGSEEYYLCVVIDLFSSKVIGWNISSICDTNLTKEAFQNAYTACGCPAFIMLRSERRAEYTGYEFRNTMKECAAIQSFSVNGRPYENTCCDDFFTYINNRFSGDDTVQDIDGYCSFCMRYIELYNSRQLKDQMDDMALEGKEA